MNKRLIVDSGSFFARKNDVLVFGTEAWIIRTLFNICSSLECWDVAICWDSSKSLRKEMYPEYKANRKDDEEFSPEEWAIFNKCKARTRKSILPEIGFANNFMQSGYEADDLIAKAIDNHYHNIIVSNDHDLYQLLSDTTEIYHPMKKVHYTYQDFTDDYGIEPYEWINFKCMKGDSSDNIPGIKGIGEKRALQIIKRGAYKETSEAYFDIINRNTKLMELPFSGCKDILWNLNQPNQTTFEKLVDRYNLQWFYTPVGMACAKKFFEGYRATKVRKSIKIRKPHEKRTQ